MKISNPVLTLKPYLIATITVLSLASYTAGANGYDNNQFNERAEQHAFKKSGHGHHIKKMKQRFKMMAMELELSKEQRLQVREIFSNTKAEKKERREELSGFKAQLKLLAQDSVFDEEKFKAIYAEFQPVLENIAIEKAKVRHAIYQILTPEQKEKFNSMKGGRGQFL